MNYLKVLSMAGLLAGSVSASAAYINLPEKVEYDINKSPTTFETGALKAYHFDYDYSFDDGLESTETIIPRFRISLESENYYGSISGDGGFTAGNILAHFFIGAADQYDLKEGKERLTAPVFGETYKFEYDVSLYHWDIGCSFDCISSSEGLTGSMLVSFFEGEQEIDVPVGPTAPLLALGLAGIAIRRR
ncbi:MAG: hypothetical protein CME36_12190 [unclassified Hahellaceae]|nr:hypothetical protein [Hahellaceae bacterium]|tara:strand:+ start:141515 stop:142084 length:570 start_codon:yes stop_codon:yes gene_type:complete